MSEIGTHNIIVIGASSGGVEALRRLVASLPADLPATVLVVLHQSVAGYGLLAPMLQRAGPLPVSDAIDGETIRRGHIYTAVPDNHLIIESGRLRVVRGPRENFSRPSIDPLFRSAAQEFRARVIGVILSGTLNDGTGGLWRIKRQGGVAIVQDPRDAAFPGMPQSAIDNVSVDYVLPLNQIGPMLVKLAHISSRVSDPVSSSKTVKESGVSMPNESVQEKTTSGSSEFETLPDVVQQNQKEQLRGERHGHTSLFVCPECGGLLWQADAGKLVQFRCHVGHSYTGETLAAQQAEILERSLWFSIRTLADRKLLLEQLAQVAHERGDTAGADEFEREAAVTEQHRATLQQLVEK